MPQPTKKQVKELADTISASQEADRLRALLLEARSFVDRARVSHLGIDPVINLHNRKCMDLIGRIDAELKC